MPVSIQVRRQEQVSRPNRDDTPTSHSGTIIVAEGMPPSPVVFLDVLADDRSGEAQTRKCNSPIMSIQEPTLPWLYSCSSTMSLS